MSAIDRLFRKLPFFRGKQRIVSFLFKRKIDSAKDLWVDGKYKCSYLLPNLEESISKEIFVNGIYEDKTSGLIVNRLPKGGVFLDLGANIGAISVPVCKQRQDARIVCVEASPYVFDYLAQNLARNECSKVTAVNKALFYEDDMELDFYAPESRFGQGSFSPNFTSDATKVKTIKLDSLLGELKLPKVDLIKIDVEGYEYHVFKGATDLLEREDAPDILFEFSSWAEQNAHGIQTGSAQELLRDLGYKIFYFHDKKRHMNETTDILRKGFFMLYATKKSLNN